MSSGERQVRLVIQSVPGKGGGPLQYRVIVYPERAGFRGPLIFSSKEELLERLREAIPDFDAASLRPTDDTARVLFAGTLELSDAQMAELYRA